MLLSSFIPLSFPLVKVCIYPSPTKAKCGTRLIFKWIYSWFEFNFPSLRLVVYPVCLIIYPLFTRGRRDGFMCFTIELVQSEIQAVSSIGLSISKTSLLIWNCFVIFFLNAFHVFKFYLLWQIFSLKNKKKSNGAKSIKYRGFCICTILNFSENNIL